MAEFKGIQLKRSTTAGVVPETAQLVEGELAINLADETLYSKKASGVFQVKSPVADGGVSYAKLSTDARNSINTQVADYLGSIATQEANSVTITGGSVTGVTLAATGTLNSIALGTNGSGTKTISTSAPSGGSDGDIWYKV